MSNSIWKTPDQKPDGEDTYIAITNDGLICDFVSPKMCDNSVDRWAYVKDIIALADKAERLQVELDELKHIKDGWARFSEQKHEQIQRLRKAVDLLVGHLQDVLRLDEYGHIKLDEITKQQIETAISDPVGIITQLEQESNN